MSRSSAIGALLIDASQMIDLAQSATPATLASSQTAGRLEFRDDLWEPKETNMGMDEVPLSVFVLLCNEHWDAETAVMLLKAMGYGPYSSVEFDEHKERLRSKGVDLDRARRLLQAKLSRRAMQAELREIAERLRLQRLMLASLDMLN